MYDHSFIFLWPCESWDRRKKWMDDRMVEQWDHRKLNKGLFLSSYWKQYKLTFVSQSE